MSKVDSIDTSKLQLQTRQSSSINLRTIICFSAYRSACFERDISQRKQCEAENRRRLSSCVLTEQACAARGNAASALLCDFAVLGEVNTVCFCRCSASQAACVTPPISILSSASHFCHQFGNNCHHHSVLVKSLFLTTQTSYQHAEIFFSDYRRVCVGGGFTLEL